LVLICDAVDHDLLSQFLLERGPLSPSFESRQSTRFGVFFALGAAQLARRRRHLLALGPEHAPFERFERCRRSDERAAQFVELALMLLRKRCDRSPQLDHLITPGALVINWSQYSCLITIESGALLLCSRRLPALRRLYAFDVDAVEQHRQLRRVELYF